MPTYSDFYNSQSANYGMALDLDLPDSLDYPSRVSAIPKRDEDLHKLLAIELENAASSHAPPDIRIGEGTIILVLDTNILISSLPLLQLLFDKCALSSEPILCFLIPLIVVKELDGLKMANTAVSKAAQNANKWLLRMLEERPNVVRAQRKGETPASLGHANSADDLVLDAALYWSLQRPSLCGLLTNDQNLRIKALAHGLPALSIQPNDDAATLVSQINPAFVSMLDLPASQSFQSILTIPALTSPVQSFDEDIEFDIAPPIENASPVPNSSYTTASFQLTPHTASIFISSISQTLSQFLPLAIFQHLIRATDQYTASHLLRPFPPLEKWTTPISLTALSQTFSSLEHLWSEPSSSSELGSVASRWASTPKSGNRNIRAIRQSISDLRTVFGNEKGGNSSYALRELRDWDRTCWSGLMYDLEVLLSRGRLLDDSVGIEGKLEGWRTIVRGFTR